MNAKQLFYITHVLLSLLICAIAIFACASNIRESPISFKNNVTEADDFPLAKTEESCMMSAVHNNAWRVINCVTYFSDLPLLDMPLVNDEIFQILKSSYDQIEFIGVFERGNTELYDLFLCKFYQLLVNERSFHHRDEDFYLNDFYRRFYSSLDINSECFTNALEEHIYYFFDVDGDGTPELIMSRGYPATLDIFKYIPGTDTIIVYLFSEGGGVRLNGTRSVIQWHVSQNSFSYDGYNEEWLLLGPWETIETRTGTFEHVYIHPIDQPEDWPGWATITDEDMWTSIYIVTLPSHYNADSQIEITEQMMNASVLNTGEDILYFRVSEEQFYEINNAFMEAWDTIYERRNGVRFTFNELFGHFFE